MSNCFQEIKIILWCQRSCSTVADIREARTTFGKAHFALTNMSACQKMFCRLLEIQKIYSRRKKLCAVLQEKTISVRSDGFWRLSSPRSSELLPDQWPPPSRYRARKWERDRRRALYRRHIVFDCLRSLWERGTALFRRHIVCLLVWGRDASYHQWPLPTRDWNLIGRVVICGISWNMFYEPEMWRKSSQMATKISKTEK